MKDNMEQFQKHTEDKKSDAGDALKSLLDYTKQLEQSNKSLICFSILTSLLSNPELTSLVVGTPNDPSYLNTLMDYVAQIYESYCKKFLVTE